MSAIDIFDVHVAMILEDHTMRKRLPRPECIRERDNIIYLSFEKRYNNNTRTYYFVLCLLFIRIIVR